jgi:hypothetical protein
VKIEFCIRQVWHIRENNLDVFSFASIDAEPKLACVPGQFGIEQVCHVSSRKIGAAMIQLMIDFVIF